MTNTCTATDAASGTYSNFAVTLKFTPTVAGTYVAALNIAHTGINGPLTTLDLTTSAINNSVATLSSAPGSTVAPTGSFGTVASASNMTIYVRNTGTYGAMALNSVNITGTNAGSFSFVSIAPVSASGTPTTACTGVGALTGMSTNCAAGDISSGSYPYFAITVTFTPGAAGSYSANLNIGHTATNTSPLTLSLTGTSSVVASTVWNNSDKYSSYIVVNGGGTQLSTTGGGAPTPSQYASIRATTYRSTGKYYWESKLTNNAPAAYFEPCGVALSSTSLAGLAGYQGNSGVGRTGGAVSFGIIGDYYGCAVDLDAHTLAIYQNGSLATTLSFTAGTYAPIIGLYGGQAVTTTFGSGPFQYKPTGYTGW